MVKNSNCPGHSWPGLFLLYRFDDLPAVRVPFALLIGWTSVPAVPAGVLSAMVGLVMHYALSVSFVFVSAETKKSHRELLFAYLLSGGMGFAITAVTIFLVVDIADLPAFLGKGFAVGASFVCVYLVRAGYVFAPANKPKAAAS